MAVPTVASLSASLGRHLAPVGGAPLPDTPITAVHISELLDPGPYLTGGELLLTVGISLPTDKAGCRRYAKALRRAHVSAVALGLGPVYRAVPEPLADVCAEQEVPLLVVPISTPFLTVTKAYWNALARGKERHLSDAIAAHRALVAAAASPDAAVAVLEELARWLGGWAATLDAGGRLDRVYPVRHRPTAEALEAEVGGLEGGGVHVAASFSSADGVVVIHPLSVGDDTVGYLAVGTGTRLDASQRAVVLAACGLLSLEASRAGGRFSAEAARTLAVALLLEDGHVDAADRLGSRFGLDPLPRECRVLTLHGRDAESLAAVVRRRCPGALGVVADRSTAWFVLPAGLPRLTKDLLEADETVTGVLSELVRAEDVGPVRIRQAERLASLSHGEILEPVAGVDLPILSRRLERLAEAGPQFVASLAGYLRNHGQWEQAARELGLHRNTLRYRVDRARQMLDVDLDDADITARLWLLMRECGMA